MASSSNKMAKLMGDIAAQGTPPNAEQQETAAQLQARLGLGTRLASIFLGVTVITMAIARYV